jgi:hypothetical protein
MGDLQVGEAFKDKAFIIETASGNPWLLQAPTCTVIDELGNRAVGVVAEESNGWYTCTFTPDAAGTWCTEWALAASTIYSAYKEFKVGGGEVTDIKTETALILADTNAILTDTSTTLDDLVDDLETRLTAARAGYIDELAAANIPADVDAIKARTDRLEITKCFFSPQQALVTLDTSHTDAALPTVTLPNITGTITHAYAGIKFRMIENSNAAVNKLSGAQEIQIQAAAEGWLDCIHFVDDQFSLAATTKEGGDCIIGYTDVVATVDVFNDTYEFQWDEPLTDQDSIKLHDVQTFLMVSYY